MKKETIKELGKLILDLSKIIIAIAVIAPLVKESDFHILPLFIGVITSGLGLFLINKGVKDE